LCPARATDQYVLHRPPGDKEYLIKSCTLLVRLFTVLITQVLDLLVLGLLGEELHALGQVLGLLGQGLLHEELHTLGLAKFSTCLCRGWLHYGELHALGQVVHCTGY